MFHGIVIALGTLALIVFGGWALLALIKSRAVRAETDQWIIERLDALIELARGWTQPGLLLVIDDSAWSRPDDPWRDVYLKFPSAEDADEERWCIQLRGSDGVRLRITLSGSDQASYYPDMVTCSRASWLLERVKRFLEAAERLPYPRTSEDLLRQVRRNTSPASG